MNIDEIDTLKNNYLNICADVEIGKITIQTAQNLIQTLISLNSIIQSIPIVDRKSNDYYYPLVEMAYDLYNIKDLHFS